MAAEQVAEVTRAKHAAPDTPKIAYTGCSALIWTAHQDGAALAVRTWLRRARWSRP
ncbi:hypothetical protein [Polymorphospora sp. NPDC050346]|uniref:hypothetical protein n=1 Tax=Polymorphospora sp. NPDC050346 TaxID=3155780 RepID=UPI0033FB8387